jgi:hypothetical protein
MWLASFIAIKRNKNIRKRKKNGLKLLKYSSDIKSEKELKLTLKEYQLFNYYYLLVCIINTLLYYKILNLRLKRP